MANSGNYPWGQSRSSPAIRTNNSPYLMEVQRGARRQTGYGSFHATQRTEGQAWLGQVGKESQGHVGAKWPPSYPASLVSMEVDMGQMRAAAEPEIQQTDVNEVTAV